jgi:hypothetical protein
LGTLCKTAIEGEGRWWWWWGCMFTNVRQERGLGAKNHETEHDGSILDTLCKMTAEGDGGRWWGGANKVVVVVGLAFANTRCERGLCAKCHKTKCDGSILGVPHEMAMEGDGGKSWRGVDEVVAVVGLHICKREAEEGAGGQKPRNQVQWLNFRCTA